MCTFVGVLALNATPPTAFLVACSEGNLERVKFLHEELYVDINVTDKDGVPALACAVNNKQYKICQYLINQNVDLSDSTDSLKQMFSIESQDVMKNFSLSFL